VPSRHHACSHRSPFLLARWLLLPARAPGGGAAAECKAANPGQRILRLAALLFCYGLVHPYCSFRPSFRVRSSVPRPAEQETLPCSLALRAAGRARSARATGWWRGGVAGRGCLRL
jgi:hypothetical protein